MNELPQQNDQSVKLSRELGAAAMQLCTIEETCGVLRVSRWQVYQLINRRELKSIKIGRRRLIRSSDLEEFVRNLGSAAPGVSS